MTLQYIKLPYLFDVTKMQKELAALNDSAWQLHFQVKHYEGNWSAIPLKSIGGQAENGFISPLETAVYEDTVFLKSSPYLQTVLNTFKCNLLSVRLLKLAAGAQIHQHKDDGLCFEEGLIRIHIPIITNKGVALYLGDEKMELHEGECWYLNFNLPHRLYNKSNQDRVHLVIDATVNNWVKHLFADKTITQKKEIELPPTKFSSTEQQEMIYQLRKLNTPTTNTMADDLEKQLHLVAQK
jgi:mannose-6-phosphate isomerase-like protein (cupin superfamily)